MRLIELLNDIPKQSFSIPVEGFQSAKIELEFKPNQEGWFISIIWGNFIIKNERVSVSPNLLRQFSKIIPFGILIIGVDSIDPYTQDAWLNHCQMYVLEAGDLETIEALYV